NEETGVIPARLIDDYDIPAYTLTTTCLQGSEEKKGIMPPWDAVTTDLENIAKVTGREDIAQSKLSEIQKRRDDLESAPKPKSPGTVFFYDITVKDGVLAGGALSAGHAIIEDAGGRNALEDIDEELTTVAWERLAADRPDFFLISDYGKGPYSYEGKVKDLKTNPATKDLPAVREGRFLRLPAPMLLGTPLMIDSAELLRKALEDEGLAPESSIEPELEIHDESNGVSRPGHRCHAGRSAGGSAQPASERPGQQSRGRRVDLRSRMDERADETRPAPVAHRRPFRTWDIVVVLGQ